MSPTVARHDGLRLGHERARTAPAQGGRRIVVRHGSRRTFPNRTNHRSSILRPRNGCSRPNGARSTPRRSVCISLARRKKRSIVNWETTTDLEFADTPLSDVVDYIKNKHEIEIQLDPKGLTDAAVDPSAPVTRSVKGISLRTPCSDPRRVRSDLRRARRSAEDHFQGKGGRDLSPPASTRGRPRDSRHDPLWAVVWAAAWVAAWAVVWAAAWGWYGRRHGRRYGRWHDGRWHGRWYGRHGRWHVRRQGRPQAHANQARYAGRHKQRR